MQLDEFGKSKAKGHDLQLYDVHSEAAFYSVKGVCDKTYRVFAFIGKPTMELSRKVQSKNSLNMIKKLIDKTYGNIRSTQ